MGSALTTAHSCKASACVRDNLHKMLMNLSLTREPLEKFLRQTCAPDDHQPNQHFVLLPHLPVDVQEHVEISRDRHRSACWYGCLNIEHNVTAGQTDSSPPPLAFRSPPAINMVHLRLPERNCPIVWCRRAGAL